MSLFLGAAVCCGYLIPPRISKKFILVTAETSNGRRLDRSSGDGRMPVRHSRRAWLEITRAGRFDIEEEMAGRSRFVGGLLHWFWRGVRDDPRCFDAGAGTYHRHSHQTRKSKCRRGYGSPGIWGRHALCARGHEFTGERLSRLEHERPRYHHLFTAIPRTSC